MSDSPPPSAAGPAAPATPTDFHRAIAEELFQHVLALLEREDRTCAESDRMIHAAHASRFHWEFAGTPMNLAVGEWQCARVHTVMRHRDAALHHARTYLEMAENYDLGPFHAGHAHAALAGAFALSKPEEAGRHLQMAREILAGLTEEAERKLLESEIGIVEKELPA